MLTVDPIAVIAAAVAAFAVGAFWYGPLFGTKWRVLMNFSERHAGAVTDVDGMSATSSMIGAFIATLALVYAFAVVMKALGVQSAGQAAWYGFMIAAGFIATTMSNALWYERRPLALYLINVSHYVAALIVAALVLFYIG